MHRRVFVGSLAIVATLFASPDARAMGALEAIARDAAKALGAVPDGAIVVAAPLASDEPAPKGDDLAARVASLTAGKVGAAARAHPRAAPLAVARAIAGKGGALVFVQLEIVKGELHATADVYPATKNSWDRIRNPAPAPTAHGFASAKIDAEVRAFLAPIVLEQAAVHKAKHGEVDVLAAACGDVGGGLAIAIVSRARVVVGRVRGGAFVVERAALWSALARRAPAPLREPLGAALFVGDALFVATTDRGPVALAPDLTVGASLRGIPIATGAGAACVSADPATSALVGPAIDCAAPDAKDDLLTLPASRVDAVAATTIVAPDGTERPVVAAREPSGKLHVRVGDAASVLDSAGAEVAVADLDQDGVPELVTTADGADDFVRIASLSGADTRVRRQIPAPAGVRALAVCPPEERGVPVLVAVVGGEVWLVR